MAGKVDRSGLDALYRVVTGAPPPVGSDASILIWPIVQRGPQCPPHEIEAALELLNIESYRCAYPRQMLAPMELVELVRSGNAIGAHGKTHTALTFASDLASELETPLIVLKEILASEPEASINALSFPHGAFTAEIAAQALRSGYEIAFATGSTLNPLRNGFLQNPILFRIDVDGTQLAVGGRLKPERIAAVFFTARHSRSASGRSRKVKA